MAKQWPDFMGTYKAQVLETGLGVTKNEFPQFIVRAFLTAYYDEKANEWYDVSDNQWTINAYLALFGHKNSNEAAEIVPTLNHQQVIKVFEWDGCGPEYLASTDFSGKEIQVRITENTGEKAKSPCQVSWIDVVDADPSNTLRTLDAQGIVDMKAKFASLWGKKPVVATTSTKKTPIVAAPKAAVATKTATAKDKSPAEEHVETPEERKANMLKKAKRLQKVNATEDVKTKAKLPAKKTAPAKEELADEATDVPPGYDKSAAWNDCVDLKADECDEEQLTGTWNSAIAEIAPDSDEDKLDAAGWFAVKEQVLSEVGKL